MRKGPKEKAVTATVAPAQVLAAKNPSIIPTNGNPQSPSKEQRLDLLREVSVNRWRYGFQYERLLNPDDLVGRKGLRIYRQMLTDDQVKAALSLKKHAILTTGWDVEPASDSPEDGEAADFCRWTFQHMDGSLDDDLLEILSSLQFGYSCTELVYRPIVSGQFAGKLGLRALKTRLPDDFAFLVDTHDNLLENGIEQFGKKLPTWKFVISSAGKEFDNWYGTSDLRAAYRPWWMKDFTLKAWGMFLDRYSVPLALGTYPAGAVTDDAMIGKLRSALENLQLATALTMPNDYKVDFPAVGAQGSSIFALAIDRMDAAIAKAILVPNLLGVSPQGDVGSFSQARKQFDVFILVIEKLQRDLAETAMKEQVIKRLVDLNYAVEEYPEFVFLPFTETDKSQLLSLWFQAVAAGGVTGRPEDEAHIRSVTEFPDVPLEELQAAEEAKRAQEAGGGGFSPGLEGSPGLGVPSGSEGEIPGGPEGETPSDEELDALIDEVLGGQGAGGKEHRLAGRVIKALRAKGVKGYAGEEGGAQDVSAVLDRLEADHPEWSDEELVAAAVAKLAGDDEEELGDLPDEDLDELIDGAQGTANA